MWSSWRGCFQSRAAIDCPTINTSLPIYVQTIIDGLRLQPSSFAQGDLDCTNILVTDKKGGAIIDWESSGYFPAYSEWEALDGLQRHKARLMVPIPGKPARCLCMSKVGRNVAATQSSQQYAQWELTPEDREENRTRGCEPAQATSILGQECAPPSVSEYPIAHSHPWWIEQVE